MFKSVSHYIQRSRELGFFGSLLRAWVRAINLLVLWSQSIWWGWKARREMSDVELLRRTIGKWRSVNDLLDYLASRPASSFMLPQESPQDTALILYQYYPEYVSTVITAANAACWNELSLLGQVFHFSPGIDWHRDPVTGWHWPLWHRSRLGQYLGSPLRPADLRFSWELNRHQHFITLGIAYWLTGDQRYVDAFCSQIQSWIEKNPLQHGINWYSSMEISIRLLAWTVAFQFFRCSPEFQEKTGKTFLKSLWQQVDFLSTHLQSTMDDVPNNHMMAELVGLAIIGAAFPEFRAAAAWRETGLSLLNQQATAQTHLDGVDKEQATGYHRFVAELLLLIVARSRQGALPHAPVLEHTLERMLDYVLFTMTPDGTSPMWGDSDFGRTLGLGQNKDFWDFRPILSAGGALFGREDWKFAAGYFDEEAYWLLGSDGLDLWNTLDVRLPEQTSQAFPQSGLYVIRDSWAADTDVAYFRCGSFGLGGEGHCAHAHCDLLSFVLWMGGQPLLVDSGTFTYLGSWRDYFRLTAAHNTVMVDGNEQALPMPNFNWKQIPEAECINWKGKRVTGKLIYPGSIEFTRELVHPHLGVWDLFDKFTGQEEHTIEWFFHFAPDLNLQNQEERLLMVLKQGGAFVSIQIPQNGIHYELNDGWYSNNYGDKRQNRVLYAQWQGKLEDTAASFHWRFQFVNERDVPPGGYKVDGE
jgi:hypothetical protein